MIELRPEDIVLVTGTPTAGAGPDPPRYDRLRGMVATVSADGYFKLWPDDPRLRDGKLWFDRAACEVEVVERGENWPAAGG